MFWNEFLATIYTGGLWYTIFRYTLGEQRSWIWYFNFTNFWKILKLLEIDIPDEDYCTKLLRSKHIRKSVLIAFNQTDWKANVLEHKKLIKLKIVKCNIPKSFSHPFMNEDMLRYVRDPYKKPGIWRQIK